MFAERREDKTGAISNRYLGATWTRQFWQVASQGAYFDAVGLDAVNVGTFAYLYHEFSLGLAAAQFQGQGEQSQPDGSGEPYELRSHVIMSAVARGLMPTPFANDVNRSDYDEWHARVAESNAAANKVWAAWPEFLVFGTTVAPPRVRGPVLETYEMLDATTRRNLSLPAVLVGSFRHSAKSASGAATVSTLILNARYEAVEISVELPWDASRITWRDGATRDVVGAWPAGARGAKYSLPPLGAVVIEAAGVALCDAGRPCADYTH